jgi:hypothetical protein
VSYPVGFIEDIPVIVGAIYIPTDFVVVDIDKDSQIPILLGRPFLATAGAICNIPLVSIGILPVKRARGRSSWKVRAMEMFINGISLVRVKYQSWINAFEMKGNLVRSRKRIYKCFWGQNYSFPLIFLSLGLRERILSSLSLSRTALPLFS